MSTLSPEQKARKAENDKARRARNKLGKTTASVVKPTRTAPPAKKSKAPAAAAPKRPGGPPLKGKTIMGVLSVRLEDSDKEKYFALGGHEWLRKRIAAGTVTPATSRIHRAV